MTTAYLVTSTVVTPIAGKLGDLFGRKPFALIGIAGFLTTSWVCGAAQTMTQLVVFRGLQGLFGGILLVTVFTVLADIFPPDRLARVQGLFGAVFGVSAVFGPTLGGWITDTLGWRWVFYVNLPAGALALVMVTLYLPFVRTADRGADVDVLGAVLIAAGLTPILIGLSLMGGHPWHSITVLGPIGCGLAGMILFLWLERTRREP
ncbi:MAG: MFS transporter, partial [Chloroflexi bacterium]|nr:MFS transporter [Chloroflexota bacterium]